MIRPAAFVGELVDITPDFPNRSAVVHTSLDVHELGRFFTNVGVPLPPEDEREPTELPPCLILLACRRPAYPERDEDIIAEASLKALRNLILARSVVITPSLGQQLGELLRALQSHPDIVEAGETAE